MVVDYTSSVRGTYSNNYSSILYLRIVLGLRKMWDNIGLRVACILGVFCLLHSFGCGIKDF